MKWIVERCGTAGAYGPGWTVIDPSGFGVTVDTYTQALDLVRAGIEFAHVEVTC